MSFYFRPNESVLERARKRKLKDKMTAQIIKDIVTYAIFLLVVVFLAYSEKDPNTFYLRKDLEDMFSSSKYAKGPALETGIVLLFINKIDISSHVRINTFITN